MTAMSEEAVELGASRTTMTAAVRERYGPPAKVVELREVDKPTPADDEVLVRVHAASVNIADWYEVVGRPRIGRFAMGLTKPKEIRLGVDYAGVVEAVGKDVTEFRPGDEVFGGRTGAYAEYVVGKAARAIVHKPANASFEVAAAVPVAAITALQALRDKGGLQPGQKVLVHGASGGVGTYTVQIAKALGATVTAVCSTSNVEIARSLGADRVVDYTVEDCTRDDERYDLLIDIAGTRPFTRLRRVLKRNATVVVVGGPRKNRLLGPLGHVIRTKLASFFTSQKTTFFIAQLNKEDLETLRDLLADGTMTSVIDSTFPLQRLPDALQHMGEGHPRGKIVVTV
ncbi:MAG TPA: NAD(P)-dependent alcohol dehydrogenase [Gaiellaceae bacterium]|nr:NAD(P)-dependent alcohol dehydrogenase [Gaiellaceae bacterium]